MKIHFEDAHYIVVQKPPAVPCQSDQTGDPDLLGLLEAYLKERDGSPKSLYLVHRLDRPVGGLIAYAKSKKAADKLTQLIKARQVEKNYLCVVCGQPKAESAHLVHYLKKKGGQNMSIAVHKNNEGAKEARLSYRSLSTVTIKRDLLTLVQVQLDTGRHHQIRVQFSTESLPLWGDAKYHPQARRKRNWTQIALWSYNLVFTHPFTGKQISVTDMPRQVDPWLHFTDPLNELNLKTDHK